MKSEQPKPKRRGVYMTISYVTIQTLREAGFSEERLVGAREVVIDGVESVEIESTMPPRKKKRDGG